MTTKDILIKDKYIIRFYNELKDEVICFLDKNENIKIYSSFCPHFGGEIYYDKKMITLDANCMIGNFVKIPESV